MPLNLHPYRCLLSLTNNPVTLTNAQLDALIAEIEELRSVLAACLLLARGMSDVTPQQQRYIDRGSRLLEVTAK